jgi:hypothetical protein
VAGDKDWLTFRPRAFRTSGVLVAASTIGLLLIYHYAPPPAGTTEKGWHLTNHQFGLLQTLLTTVLSLGAISLLFEFLLRKSWAEDLLRFLRLNVVVAKAGIQLVTNDAAVEWNRTLPQAVEIRALVRDPSRWFQTNLALLMKATQRHAAKILIGVPDPQGPNFQRVAESVGLTEDQLRQFIDVARQTVEAQWAALKPHIDSGSTFRIVTFDGIPLFEVISVDNSTFCLLTRPLLHGIGDDQLALEFLHDTPQYPADWLRQVLDPLEDANELLLRDVNT